MRLQWTCKGLSSTVRLLSFRLVMQCGNLLRVDGENCICSVRKEEAHKKWLGYQTDEGCCFITTRPLTFSSGFSTLPIGLQKNDIPFKAVEVELIVWWACKGSSHISGTGRVITFQNNILKYSFPAAYSFFGNNQMILRKYFLETIHYHQLNIRCGDSHPPGNLLIHCALTAVRHTNNMLSKRGKNNR